MRGHIRKRSKDSWTVVVELPRDPETGKRRQKWVTVRGPKREAERVLADLLAKLNHGMVGTAPSSLTVQNYLENWLDTVKNSVRPQTFNLWRKCVKYWSGLVGDVPLSKLTPLEVQQAVVRLSERITGSTVRTLYKVFRTAMRQAVKWELIPKSPADGVRLPAENTTELRAWDEEQVSRFLEQAAKSRYYTLFYVALATGMRLGELLGLVWDDVDLKASHITVRRSLCLCAYGEPQWQEPKTPRSRRKIPIDSNTARLLQQWRRKQLEEKLRAGPRWHNYNLVFTTREGRPLDFSTIAKALKRLADRAGVPRLRFHDLRHTHATLLLRQGVHPKVVAERLGHTTVQFTLDKYSHVLPDTQREAVRALEQTLPRVCKG